MGYHHRGTIRYWMVVSQGRRFLPSSGLARSVSLVYGISFLTYRLVVVPCQPEPDSQRNLRFASIGSVSCGVWQFACRRVIKVGERVTRDLLGVGEIQ